MCQLATAGAEVQVAYTLLQQVAETLAVLDTKFQLSETCGPNPAALSQCCIRSIGTQCCGSHSPGVHIVCCVRLQGTSVPPLPATGAEMGKGLTRISCALMPLPLLMPLLSCHAWPAVSPVHSLKCMSVMLMSGCVVLQVARWGLETVGATIVWQSVSATSVGLQVSCSNCGARCAEQTAGQGVLVLCKCGPPDVIVPVCILCAQSGWACTKGLL